MSLPAGIVRRMPVRVRLPLLVYVVCQLILLVWWAAYFPGLMSYDSIAYVWHVTTDHWMANHSVAYDGLVWLSLKVSGDLWPLTLLQTVAAAAVLAYAARVLHALGVRARWAALGAVIAPALPPLGTFLIYVWKDVPFTLAAILIFAATGRLIAARRTAREPLHDHDGGRGAEDRAPGDNATPAGEISRRETSGGKPPSRETPGRQNSRGENSGVIMQSFTRDAADGGHAGAIALLALGFIGLVVFRNNGFLSAAIAAPILIIALAGRRVAVAAATVLPIALSFVLTGWLYPALDIKGARPSLTYATAYADVAVAYDKRPGTFTAADLALMSKVAPLWQWRAGGANCYDSDWLTHSTSFDNAVADADNARLRALWMKTIKRSPGVVAAARVCRGSIAWRITPGPQWLQGNTRVAGTTVGPTRFGWARRPTSRMSGSPYLPVLRIRPLSVPLNHAAQDALRATRTPSMEWLLLRAPFWIYLGYLSVAAYVWVRRRPGALALVAPIVGIQLAVLAANPAQLFRYMTGPLFLGILAVPLLTVLRRGRRARGAPPAEEADRDQPRVGQVFAR